jgi:hemerythrin superfamily protein
MGQNAIDFLLGQHQQVEKLLDGVKTATGEARQETFDELRHLLAVHEAAEELILRPVTRTIGDNGQQVADARMAEENEAKEVLAKLEKLDVASQEFITTFESFATDVLEHAQNEENQEFPLIRDQKDEAQLEKIGAALETAEKVAPTHPHPSAKTTTANAVLGPFASILDRAKDAISAALKD